MPPRDDVFRSRSARTNASDVACDGVVVRLELWVRRPWRAPPLSVRSKKKKFKTTFKLVRCQLNLKSDYHYVHLDPIKELNSIAVVISIGNDAMFTWGGKTFVVVKHGCALWWNWGASQKMHSILEALHQAVLILSISATALVTAASKRACLLGLMAVAIAEFPRSSE